MEEKRLAQDGWKNWGPYLSERAWGTVREDYSEYGEAWDFLPHDHARSKAYRWNEDGLAGISDVSQYLCFALALWNGHDPILKERMFGLTGAQGNHGEDVKEYYFYLDSTPTHSYMKMLYKYPQAEYPYGDLVGENGRRGFHEFEYELLDTGVFSEDRYFDVLVEYAKVDTDDILIKISVTNHGPEAADCHIVPNLWYRNTWSWGYENGPMGDVSGKPQMKASKGTNDYLALQADHPAQGTFYLYAEGAEQWMFTENDTNAERLYGLTNATPYVKDSFHRYLINGEIEAIQPLEVGTKAAALYRGSIEPGATREIHLRLTNAAQSTPFKDFEKTFQTRIQEADAFYASIQKAGLNDDVNNIQRQALAGMLWSKQLFYYDIEQWLQGDPSMPTPPASRWHGRNHDWEHLNNFDIISMPDKWEYPWYATWDLAFHCIPLAMVDSTFAKQQLEVMTREWYMHPNGQLPAYEWAFGDVNPPVHAWAAYQVYKMEGDKTGTYDRHFLESIYHKLLLNFTWWVNKKDRDGRNVFQGGFLGLDNISIFDRSAELPTGGFIDQSDGTSWMGFFSVSMLTIALELAKENPVYQDTATKFFEHYLYIAQAMTNCGGSDVSLWDETDGFFYDELNLPDGQIVPVKVRSLVGLMTLIAMETISNETLETMPEFATRFHWFVTNRPHLSGNVADFEVEGEGRRHLMSFVTPERLRRVLAYMLDENEFFSDYGIRSVSKYHQDNPYSFEAGGQVFMLNYQPAESESGLFGGNSNWRGPIWFPINYLLIEALRKYHFYYGDDFKVECPTGSGTMMHLGEVADEISHRLMKMFMLDENQRRPIYGGIEKFQTDWRDYVLFNEYFHGDNGAGLGASHQTGWTGLIADIIQKV